MCRLNLKPLYDYSGKNGFKYVRGRADRLIFLKMFDTVFETNFLIR